MDERLRDQLRAVADRYRSLRLWKSLATIWLIAAVAGGVLLWLKMRSEWTLQAEVLVVGAAALVMAFGMVCLANLSFRDPKWAAYRIEKRFPDLEERLITAVGQRRNAKDGSYGYLQSAVLDETLSHAKIRGWTSAVSQAQLARARWLNVPALLLLTLVLVGLWTQRGPALPVPDEAIARTLRGAEAPRITVVPGNDEIERGSRLIVTAEFHGTVPKEAALIAADSRGIQRFEMTRNLKDPIFSGQVFDVNEALSYHVAFPGGQSETYQVTVFEYPRLVRADARLSYPTYTQLDDRLIEDTLRVTAVEGSALTWLCHLNKDVREAKLVDEDGNETDLSPDSAAPHAFAATIELTRSRRWELQLVDAEGKSNIHPVQLVGRVVPNRPADIKLALARDLRVSPLEEIPIQASFKDDFSLLRFGVSYTMAGATEEVVLGESAGQQKQDVSHLLDFEAMGAEPDQLLSYYFWAEDNSPDGDVRRTVSDMYFAEVRHFEEIFRQGQQPPGGQSQQQPQQDQQQQGGQNAQQAEQLAEMQKQIITGTWNVIRRETSPKLSEPFVDDVTLLRDSQVSAIEQLQSLAQQVSDEQSQGYVEDVGANMEEAAGQLTAAVDGPSKASLPNALAAAQAAYEGLLKLRAREHEVIRGQQQQQGASSSSSSNSQRFQQQIEELQLRNNESNYEAERQAQQPQNESDEQREMRQVLNRLRELAQRQEDLNEQVRQLQTALQEAQTEEEREELERQLKRLRDQQEEMLRDTDELAERMSEAQNQSEMQEPREQLEEARENVRQSAEALRERNASQALTAGTRAERQFEELQDDVRRRTANQFSETMREMRQQVREMDSRQQELGERIAELQQEDRGSLRGNETRSQARDQLAQQREELEGLLDRMEQTVQEADGTEPLLAGTLYEAHQEARRIELDQRLETTSELLRRGFDSDAQQLERTAREGVTNLRQSIEQAAEEVLGDETEALRRALTELERLSQEINQEIAREDPNGTESESEAASGGQPSQDGQRAQENRPLEQGQPSEDGPPSIEGQPPSEGQSPGEGRPSDQGQPSGEGQSSDPQQPGQGQPSDQRQSGEGQPPQQSQPSQSGSGRGSGGPQQQPQDSDQQQQGSPNQSDQPSENQQQGGRGGQGGRGDQDNSDNETRTPSDRQQEQQPGEGQPGRTPQPGGDNRRNGLREGAQFDAGGGFDDFGIDSLGSAPIAGDGFRDFSDTLRDVEEMVDDPEMRSEAARIRQRAREIRRNFQENGDRPKWNLVRDLVAEPLDELKERVAEELLRRAAEKNEVVPIDREPVPDQFKEQVERYRVRIGGGR